jgi:serine/threonine protein kinase
LQSASELKSALESNESFKLSKISGIVTEKFKRTYNKAPVISFKMTIDGGETELKGAFKKEKNGRCTIAAAGAFGRTFFGVTPSGRKVAVKVVQKKTNEDMKDIIEEVRLLNRVNGFDGLVGASDVFQEGDFIFIVMDQMEGGELSDKKDLSLSQKTTIFRDVGKGVKQCEYLGIVHMDIKAENILLTEDNRAKLADFGLSLENGQSGCRGTLLYMAPEVFNQTPVSSQTDVYSVGVLLYIKLYNRLPYLGVTNLKELCNKKIKGYDILDELTSPPQSYAERFFNGRFDVMEAYNQLIRDCMQSNQDSRPTPKELLSRLEKIQRLLDTRGNNQPVQ